MRARALIMAIMLVGLAGPGCKKAPPAEPAGSPAAKDETAAPGTVSGKVLETINSGGYTYLKLATKAGERWAAVRQAEVASGSSVTIEEPMEMKNFKSKTLERTFPSIYFGRLQGQAAGKGMGMGKGKGEGKGDPHAGMGNAVNLTKAHGAIQKGKQTFDKPIAKAEGPDGQTVASIFAKRAELKGKTVSVRGRVTKFNANIMGRNWIHLQDGSGSAAASDFDLTVTSKATAAVGDVVLVKGVLATGKEFGAGYTYDVIVEDASLTK